MAWYNNYKDSTGTSFYRVRKDGKYYYARQYKICGNRKWTPLFDTVGKVKKFIRDIKFDTCNHEDKQEEKVFVSFGQIAKLCYEDYEKKYKEENRSPRYLENIDVQMRIHISKLSVDGIFFYDRDVSTTTSELLMAYKMQINDTNEGRAKATVKKTFDIFNSIINYAMTHGYIARHIVVDSYAIKPQGKKSKTKQEKMNYFSYKEFIEFLSVYDNMFCTHNSMDVNKEYRYLVYRTLFIFLYYSGCRISEVRGIKWNKVTFCDENNHLCKISIDGQYINTYGKEKVDGYYDTLKTSSSNRTVYLHMACYRALQRYKEFLIQKGMYNQNSFVFAHFDGYNAKPFSLCSIREKFRLIKEKMGIDTNGRCVTIHGFRHSACIFYLERGMNKIDVARMLGHTNTDMVDEVYSHVVAYEQLENEKQERLAKYFTD